MLVLALVTSAAAFIGFGLSPGYPRLLLAAALLGLANSVLHPADYAILSARIPPARVGRAFSIHTFCGFLGTAVAPVTTIAVAASLGLGFCPSSAKGILRLPASGSRRAICGGLVQRRNIDLNQRGPISRRSTHLPGFRGYATSDILGMQQRSGSVTMSSFPLVSATGMLGSGFRAESLDKAISLGARMIGCDAGSTDPGGPGWKPIYIPLSSRRRHLADVLGGNGLVSFCR